MTKSAASRLATGLMALHGKGEGFQFELDTHENASVLAEELQALGCEVTLMSYGARIEVRPPREQ